MSNRNEPQPDVPDWPTVLFGIALVIILVVAAVGGHHIVSLGVAP